MRPVPTVSRETGWPERLAAFIAERRNVPFAWGRQDCVAFACDAVVHLVGIDPLAPHRGMYASETEAEAILEPAGGLEAYMTSAMAAAGLPECPKAFVQRGDVALIMFGNQLTMGVVTGTAVAVTGPDGLAFIPRWTIQRAWAV